ncbi:MAG: 1-(5-phosphoribosyl)-5-[(5-phosphoribosylamino)methylideneamino]imidazole-4-carboxamide isomerase [Saprospiraceae bacterium]|nr:1-(5-phosphoribosyl)-5-[(5-phosphoribosylamino)methylideneamino]imidazole-4-carboxamide isomerase [Saprospiraceae bacterium]
MQTKIYPAIDIIDGQCVRLTKGNYDTVKVYDSEPLEVAKQFEDAGAKYLHVVDLDAAKNPENNNRKLISRIIRSTRLLIQTGGGIRQEADVAELLDLGADRLIIGSVAVTKRDEVYDWISNFGGNRIVIGADVKDEMIATHGWLKVSDEKISDFIVSYMQHGGTTFLCTDISKDGMLAGSSIDLYGKLIQQFPGINLLASGGVTSLDEVEMLKKMGMEGIIIGKAIYEQKIKVSDLF